MHEYERVNWQDAPDKTTPLSAANLNNMDNGIAALYYDVGILEQLINQQSIQNASQMTVEYNQEDVDTDPGLQASGSSLQNFITGIHGRLQAIQAAIDSDPTHLQVANNLNTTQEGYVLDARQGPVIKLGLDQLKGNLTSNTEPTNTALGSYEVGEYMYHQGYVCRVIQAIQEGDELVLGRNIRQVSITSRLQQLENIESWSATDAHIMRYQTIDPNDYSINAHKYGHLVWVHGYHYLVNGTTSQSIITRLPWTPIAPASISCQSDANGEYRSGYLDVDIAPAVSGDTYGGCIKVGTTWSGATRYSFVYLTND